MRAHTECAEESGSIVSLPSIAEIVSNHLKNRAAFAKSPTTEVGRNREVSGEPDQPMLIPAAPTCDIPRDPGHEVSTEFLIGLIELSLIIFHESSVPSIEQIRAKHLLQDALNLHPDGFIALNTNQPTGNVDWEALLTLFIRAKKLEDNQIISHSLKTELDDWFRSLDDFRQALLLDALLPQGGALT